ncbi:MAG: hypothetical protein ABL984_05425 [Pyrinomonadaceae bacterium]
MLLDSEAVPDDFLDEALLVVSDAAEASAQNLTTNQKGKRAEVWARLLYGIVPIDMLQPAFLRAIRDHESSFPIDMHDVERAYKRIVAETPVDFRFCDKCNDDGLVKIEGAWRRCRHENA